MNTYNTVKDKLILKEYGRNIQNLVRFLNTIEDKEERSRKASALIDIMKKINFNIKDVPEMQQKLWDDIHIISDFKLEVDGKFPKPGRDIIYKKPQRLNYKKNEITFKHFGRNIELFVDKACTLKDSEEREVATIQIGKLMKAFFYSYSRDSIDNNVICQNIKKLSGGKLKIDIDKVSLPNLFEPHRKERKYTNNKDKRNNDKNRSKNSNTKKSFKIGKN